MLFSGNFSSKLVRFGQKLRKMSEISKTKLQKCENVWRNLAAFSNSERCKSLFSFCNSAVILVQNSPIMMFFRNFSNLYGNDHNLLDSSQIFWNSGKFSSKLVKFGQILRDMGEILKVQLQKCENVWRNLAQFLNAERCKSLFFQIAPQTRRAVKKKEKRKKKSIH